MGKWVHRLRDIDKENRKANCANCGPVRLISDGTRLVCANLKAEKRVKYPDRRKWYQKHQDKERIVLAILSGVPCEICDSPAEQADHCHETGKWRGALCKLCNTGIGFFEDNPELLRSAADYIDKYK